MVHRRHPATKRAVCGTPAEERVEEPVHLRLERVDLASRIPTYDCHSRTSCSSVGENLSPYIADVLSLSTPVCGRVVGRPSGIWSADRDQEGSEGSGFWVRGRSPQSGFWSVKSIWIRFPDADCLEAG